VVINQSASSTDRIEMSPESDDDIDDTEDEETIEDARTFASILVADAAAAFSSSG
jgi:hypothetical protein